jgi:hypothetical protein
MFFQLRRSWILLRKPIALEAEFLLSFAAQLRNPG